MTQPPIDLLPESIRRDCQAGVRAGRYVAALALAIVVIVVGTTHQRLEYQRVSDRLAETKEKADFVLRLGETASKLEKELEQANAFIDMQQQLAWPMEVSALLATIVNKLPESMTIDRIDLDAGSRRSGRSPRSRGDSDRSNQARMLRGEMAGFASSDEEIAELINQLQETAPFHNVSLDFSRSRSVWGVPAREFRLSFRIDLNRQYEVEHLALTQTEERVDDAR